MLALIVGILVAEILIAICVVLLSDLLARLRLQQLQPKCERDIPKKPLEDYVIDIHTPHKWGRCPKCGHLISSGSYAWSSTQNNYCESCGQRIDWNKEKLGKKIQKVFKRKKH